MSATRRRRYRRFDVVPAPPADFQQHAVDIRQEWLAHALSCEPADRAAAEAAITSLYALAGAPAPEFVWVDSPSAALDILPPTNPVTWARPQPLECRIANNLSTSQTRMDAYVARHPPWRPVGPYALSRSVRPTEFEVDSWARAPLHRWVRSIAGLLRADLGRSLGLHWRGQHDVHWIVHYDVLHRVLGTRYDPDDLAHLKLWATLARSCGWWWPRDDRCVMVERPSVVQMESLPDNELRLHSADGPAVAFRDGSETHVWHGTRVPSWVTRDPTAEKITAERNVEVRRCAIEKIGWPAFIDQAGSTLIGRAPDPGNPGHELRLYELPFAKARLLLAVNGSVERDGTRRQYGLHVPDWFDNPVDAAAWTYGLTGAQYSQLWRRT